MAVTRPKVLVIVWAGVFAFLYMSLRRTAAVRKRTVEMRERAMAANSAPDPVVQLRPVFQPFTYRTCAPMRHMTFFM